MRGDVKAECGFPCMRVVGGVGVTTGFFLSSFFLSFRTGDGLGFIRFCSWDVSEGGPAVGSVVFQAFEDRA